MIRARRDESPEAFMTRRVRLMVEADGPDGRRVVWGKGVPVNEGDVTAARGPAADEGWYDLTAAAYGTREPGMPEGVSPLALDLPQDVARAVYDELARIFDEEPETPKAGDRAYADARHDIDRLYGLVDRFTTHLTGSDPA